MLKIFITLKAWQVVLLVLIVCGIVGAFYGAYGQSSGSSTASSLAANTKLVQVQYGNLTNSVSASGSLAYATSKQLTFDSAGTVAAIYVEKDSSVKEGDVLARLDSTSVESLEGSVASARIAVRDAEDALEKAQNPYTELEIADANATVEQAQQKLLDAQTRGPLDVADAEYTVTQDENAYADSIGNYMDNKITLDDLNKAERAWERAKLDLDTAKQNADKAVLDARQNLVNAQDALANMTVDPLEVALKQSNLDSAKANLDDALEQLESAKEGYPVVAPFDGVVAEVDVEPGDDVNANTVVLKLVDPSDVEVSTTVDEIDVSQVQQGQKATISLDALSNEEFSGEVSSISAFANSQSGVVSYPVTIRLTVPSGVQLREGMSATATITTQEVDNVLLVPATAISASSTNPTVTVMVNGVPEVRAVKVGQSNDTSTEIVSGLNAGDEVVVTSSSTSSSSSSSSSRGGFGGFGGGESIYIGPIGR
jgi:HlyD family secretion protein